MIRVRVEKRMVQQREKSREYEIPEGTTVANLVQAIGCPELQQHVLVVINNRVCVPERPIASGENIVLLSRISGG